MSKTETFYTGLVDLRENYLERMKEIDALLNEPSGHGGFKRLDPPLYRRSLVQMQLNQVEVRCKLESKGHIDIGRILDGATRGL